MSDGWLSETVECVDAEASSRGSEARREASGSMPADERMPLMTRAVSAEVDAGRCVSAEAEEDPQEDERIERERELFVTEEELFDFEPEVPAEMVVESAEVVPSISSSAESGVLVPSVSASPPEP